MALELYPSTVTERTMGLTATLRACWTDASGAVPAGCTAGGLNFQLGALVNVWVYPYVRFEYDEDTPPNLTAVYLGWYVEFTGTDSVRRAMYDEVSVSTSGGEVASMTFSITEAGELLRYINIEAPDEGLITSEKLNADPLAELAMTVEDRVETYNVEITIGSSTRQFEWTVAAETPANTTIDIRGTAGSARSISGFTTDVNDEPLWEDYTYYYENQALNCQQVTWVDGTYERDPGDECAETRAYYHTHSSAPGSAYAAWFHRLTDATVSSYAWAVMGDGVFQCGGGTDANGSLDTGTSGTICLDAWGGFRLIDYLGGYTVDYSNDIKKLDESSISGVRLQTIECHPTVTDHYTEFTSGNGFIEADTYVYNGVTLDGDNDANLPTYAAGTTGLILTSGTGWTVTYGGKASYQMLWASDGPIGFPVVDETETYFDLNENWSPVSGALHHGAIDVLDVRPTWVPDSPVTPGGGSYTEGDLGEPAHPPWLPLPDQAVGGDPPAELYDEETGEPIWADGSEGTTAPWYDEAALVDSANACVLTDALVIDIDTAPGALVAVPPVQFDALPAASWDATDCAIADVAGGIKITPSAATAVADYSGIFAENIRVTGARMLEIHWDTTVNAAEAVLHLGKHYWNLLGGTAGAQTTLIDTLSPDGSDAITDLGYQSIIPYEMPQDQSIWDTDHSERDVDSNYLWDFPAGWGLGRLTKLTIECKTATCVYEFYDCQFRRKATEDDGFVKLVVLPQSGPWIDSRAMTDFALQDSGEVNMDAYTNTVAVWMKAVLIVDGAIVFEIPGAVIVENQGEGGPSVPYYEYAFTKLTDDMIGYPADDYATPTAYPVNGVSVSVSGSITGDDFWEANCLTAFLAGGQYTPDANNLIKVPIRILPHYFNPYPDCGILPSAAYKRFRGRVDGVLFTETGDAASEQPLTISSPDASPGHEEIDSQITNEIGWYESDALNTKGDAEVEPQGGTPVTIAMRNRVYSRKCATAPHLWLKYCVDNEKLVLTPGNKPALTCCD